jgi:hypothetical protein
MSNTAAQTPARENVAARDIAPGDYMVHPLRSSQDPILVLDRPQANDKGMIRFILEVKGKGVSGNQALTLHGNDEVVRVNR